MKTTGVMTGGSLASQYVNVCTFDNPLVIYKCYHLNADLPDSTYLLKAVMGVQNNGIPVYAISAQVSRSIILEKKLLILYRMNLKTTIPPIPPAR